MPDVILLDSAASEDDHPVRKETGCPKNVGDLPVTVADYTSQSPGGLDVVLSEALSLRCLVQCPHHCTPWITNSRSVGHSLESFTDGFCLAISRSDAPLFASFFPVTSRDSGQFHRPATFNIHVRGFRYVPLSINTISVLRTVCESCPHRISSYGRPATCP